MNEFNFSSIVEGVSHALTSSLCNQIDEYMTQQVNNSKAKYVLAKVIITTYKDAKPQAPSNEIVAYLSKRLGVSQGEAFVLYRNFLETKSAIGGNYGS